MKLYQIPTGYLFTNNYSRGQLETLSIGDYGKSKNIKADFLGFTDEINGVPNGKCASLSEKWVITLSTQYGCTQKCNFCDCPKIPFKGNATFDDLKKQLYSALSMFPKNTYTDRLNIHYARMGEPAFNSSNVFKFTEWLQDSKRTFQKETGVRVEVLHPVFTTSIPTRLKNMQEVILDWCYIKNVVYHGQAGLQLSINSTDDSQRNKMFNNLSLSLKDISKIANKLPEPIGRKYCLNFAFASDSIIDGDKLVSLFDPDKFMCKITPIHNNNACRANGIETIDGYKSFTPYKGVEENLKAAGFDTLVFVPSMDEENGLVTCGNSILGGGEFKL
ncbi:Fe-S-oxidoreductase [Candidatus Dojkabacteria bacterium]|jgi:23S rRNA (adenine2503-C2)-methyltransferase|nr:Fe-S-oxidoreductase [Candidatus Dojkabacteria bacterium]